MKAPFSFGLRFLLRIFLPGSILAVALMPALRLLLALAGVQVDLGFMLVTTSLMLGWVCSVMDMPIYMLFEGRRFWPNGLRERFRLREQARLIRLVEKAFQDTDPRIRREAGTDLRMSFPFDAKGTFTAEYPTRLGNLIAAYERYPDRVYGFSAPFLWYRMWLKFDKDCREEIDSQQAMADSTLYVVACLYVAATLSGLYSLLKMVHIPVEPLATPAWLFLVGGVVLAAAAWGYYRASLHAHDAFGRTFRAAFDTFLADATLPLVKSHIDQMLAGKAIDVDGMRARNKMLQDFLQSSRVSPPSGGPRVWIDQWNDEVASMESRMKRDSRGGDPGGMTSAGAAGLEGIGVGPSRDTVREIRGAAVSCPNCGRILHSVPSTPPRVSEPSSANCRHCGAQMQSPLPTSIQSTGSSGQGIG